MAAVFDIDVTAARVFREVLRQLAESGVDLWVSTVRDREGVTDVMIDNGHRAHDAEPYLNAPVTGHAIAAGLARRDK
jgi:hypothetical protein